MEWTRSDIASVVREYVHVYEDLWSLPERPTQPRAFASHTGLLPNQGPARAPQMGLWRHFQQATGPARPSQLRQGFEVIQWVIG